MSSIDDVINQAITMAKAQSYREATERVSVKEASAPEGSDIASGLRILASALREDTETGS